MGQEIERLRSKKVLMNRDAVNARTIVTSERRIKSGQRGKTVCQCKLHQKRALAAADLDQVSGLVCGHIRQHPVDHRFDMNTESWRSHLIIVVFRVVDHAVSVKG